MSGVSVASPGLSRQEERYATASHSPRRGRGGTARLCATRRGVRSAAAQADAQVLLQVRIDALDITVLKGGGAEVGRWATEHGFRLPPDAPEALDFYAARSPIFLAAVFDADAAKARGQRIGDGTPVH